jgi:hypothetical protein
VLLSHYKNLCWCHRITYPLLLRSCSTIQNFNHVSGVLREARAHHVLFWLTRRFLVRVTFVQRRRSISRFTTDASRSTPMTSLVSYCIHQESILSTFYEQLFCQISFAKKITNTSIEKHLCLDLNCQFQINDHIHLKPRFMLKSKLYWVKIAIK